MNVERYNRAVREHVNTGDVVVFSGRGAVSSVIKRHTGSVWSHVGMAIWTDGFGSETSRRLLCIESTTLNELPDVTGEYRRGVQMTLLSQRIAAYDGAMWLSRLRRPLESDQQAAMVEWLFRQHASAVPYDAPGGIVAGLDRWENWPKWLRILTWPLLGWTRSRRPDLSRLFCSELVGRALQVAGLVDSAVNVSEMTPADVVGLDCLARGPLPLAVN